jgi:hypothetical protein
VLRLAYAHGLPSALSQFRTAPASQLHERTPHNSSSCNRNFVHIALRFYTHLRLL